MSRGLSHVPTFTGRGIRVAPEQADAIPVDTESWMKLYASVVLRIHREQCGDASAPERKLGA